MSLLKALDEKTDGYLAKVGVKDQDIQNIIQVGGAVLIGALVYKWWRGRNAKQGS